MRIIAGDFKGRRLFTPKDNKIRPTTDQVKESIFSMIAAYLEDAVIIDLFSGTGNLGLEALSRGATKCYFSDRSKDSLQLTKQNIAYCKQEERSIAILGDYDFVLKRMKEKADIILLDPPYHGGLLLKCIHAIAMQNLLSEDGVIVAEHGKDEILPDQIAQYSKIKEKQYGTIIISIYGLNTEEITND